MTEKHKHTILRILKTAGKLWVVLTSSLGTLLILTLIFLFLSLAFAPAPTSRFSQNVLKAGSENKIAVIRVNGVIGLEDSDPVFGISDSFTTDELIAALDEVKNDATVKAVVVSINSPGGSVVASDDIYKKVLEVRSVKPVVAQMGDTAASGGYYIASAAHQIVANSATITGSIGAIIELPKLQGLYEKIGVEFRTIQTGPFKDIGSSSRDLTQAEQDIFNSILNDAYDQFIRAIVQGRNMDEAKLRQLADGRIYSGLQAKTNGLVDEIGNFDSAVSLAEKRANISGATVVEYGHEGFFLDFLSSKVNQLNPLTQVTSSLKPSSGVSVKYLLSY